MALMQFKILKLIIFLNLKSIFLGEHQIEGIDLSFYNFRKIRLLDICHDPNETLVII